MNIDDLRSQADSCECSICRELLGKAADEIAKLRAVVETAQSVLSEDGIRENLCCYVMGVELINLLETLKGAP